MDLAYPTIALEVGYSENDEDLVADATLLLNGTEGETGLVILIKVDPCKLDRQVFRTDFWRFGLRLDEG
jgi:hypothetical protein